MRIIRIVLPKEEWGKYEHKSYLGALMKLGLKREKVGDIIVRSDGADIIISKDIEEFLLQSLNGLIRFQKAEITSEDISDLKYVLPEKKIFKINVPSMRLDAIVGELARCSRNDASRLLEEERVFIDGTRVDFFHTLGVDEKYSFTIDVTNKGNIDTEIFKAIKSNLSDYVVGTSSKTNNTYRLSHQL